VPVRRQLSLFAFAYAANAETSEIDGISTGLGIKAETQVFQIGRFSETSETAK
jgi:hypothetical protein